MSQSIVQVFCSGELRELPLVIWVGLRGPLPVRPAEFICNGCTLSPDYILGKRAWPACVAHDYHYNKTSLSRKQADKLFRYNLKFSLTADGMPAFLAAPVALAYYFVVRKLGRDCYNSKGDPR